MTLLISFDEQAPVGVMFLRTLLDDFVNTSVKSNCMGSNSVVTPCEPNHHPPVFIVIMFIIYFHWMHSHHLLIFITIPYTVNTFRPHNCTLLRPTPIYKVVYLVKVIMNAYHVFSFAK
jgi:hypothetical protein